jgi:triacylglycerol lipase
LSILDSPAYSNLTSTYLNNVFNPSTPDNPQVKYFSVAGRTENMSVWHPLWLPKMVLDGFEEKSREKLKDEWEEKGYGQMHGKPLWQRGDQWGNDGLVTVQSAKWGEFLGILEGCDHWELRGARGIELHVDLPLSPLSIRNLGNSYGSEKSDGWDWGRFVGAWRKQEQQEKEMRDDIRTGVATAHSSRISQTMQQRDLEQEQDDAVIKSSTDKLSAVFDWVVEQVPTPPRLTPKDKSDAQIVEAKPVKKPIKNDLATKMDLERFYVALSRKLYDEGL